MHQHDWHDHDHDDPIDPSLDELAGDFVLEEIEGLEKLTISSVGIDIGSSTSHLVFSRLVLRREGSAFSSRFKVTEREVLYRSPIMLTPYQSGTLIDTDKIKDFVNQAYDEAGFTPETIDTGAVVITGEALKKENAQPIAELFARESGKFICASAGPNHEALLAAYGCGAVALSQTKSATVLNLDVGGGTTKLSLIKNGTVVATAAIEVGARLIALGDDDVVVRLEEPAQRIMAELGHTVSLGQSVSEEQKEALAQRMAELLFEVIRAGNLSPLAGQLLLTEPLKDYRGPEDVDFVVCSGGVSEYIDQRDTTAYGDLGPQFAGHIREQLAATFRPEVLQEASEGIRATVIGAGEYTVQASGSTSHLSGVASLPAFGLQVVRPLMDGGDSVEQSLRAALAKFDLSQVGEGLALALTVDEPPDYRSLRRLAEGISAVAGQSSAAAAPLFIVVDADVAKSLGGILKEELGLEQDVVVVDGIDVGDLDYLDIGRPMGVSEVVPVIVKSLVFPHQAVQNG
jgi:ethanolamine utilization protein EutA